MVIPAAEAGLQRAMLVAVATGVWPYSAVMQPADNQFTQSLLAVASGGLQSKEVYPSWSEPARRGARRPWRARDIPPQNKLLYVSHV